jgi:hypothetical protein
LPRFGARDFKTVHYVGTEAHAYTGDNRTPEIRLAFEPGARLGPYEIVAAVGAGGMGQVYRARDTRLDRSVAVKLLSPASDSDLRARFEREARVVAALDHPHICGIFDVGETGGTHYIVMPFPDGQTLAARLEKDRMPLDQLVRIASPPEAAENRRSSVRTGGAAYGFPERRRRCTAEVRRQSCISQAGTDLAPLMTLRPSSPVWRLS